MDSYQVRPARAEEWPQAFRLVFQHTPKEDRQARVRNALRLMRQRELDPAGLIVMAASETLLGAMVCLPVAGATALVWPPQAVLSGAQREIEDQLMTYAIAWLRQRGANWDRRCWHMRNRSWRLPCNATVSCTSRICGTCGMTCVPCRRGPRQPPR